MSNEMMVGVNANLADSFSAARGPADDKDLRMWLPRFALEDWFARYKPECDVNIGSSDVEPVTVADLLEPDTRVGDVSLEYGGASGSLALREQVSELHPGTGASDVQCTTGATEAVLALYSAILRPGDHVVVVTPVYQLLVDLPTALGATVTEVPLVRDGERWVLPAIAVANAVRNTTRAIVVNSPNNPTGWTATDTQLAELAVLAHDIGAVLVSDEVYRGIGPVTSTAVQLHASAVVVGSVSKTYGTAGLRVGWVVTRDAELRDSLRTVRYWTTLSSSPLTDSMAVHTLRAASRLLDRANRIVDVNADLVRDFVAARDDVDHVAPQGGTTAWVELLAHDAEDVARRLAVEHRVFTVPSKALCTPGHHLRIGLGRVDLERGLSALTRILEDPRSRR